MMDAETERVILEDYWTENQATIPLSSINVDGNMGFCTRAELYLAADVPNKMNHPKYRKMLAMDGEREHLKVVMKMYNNSSKRYEWGIARWDDPSAIALDVDEPDEEWMRNKLLLNAELLKFSASCSKTMQPCDVMVGFLVAHQFFKTDQFRLFDHEKVAPPAYFPAVEKILGVIDAASR